MLDIRYGPVQHLRDGPMLILPLVVLGCTNDRQRQN